MPRVMFVHPDAEELERWRRMLLTERNGWQVELFTAVGLAWARLTEAAPDLIVVPMCVALDGRVLLAQVRDTRPEVARVLVAGGVCDDRVVDGQRIAQRVLPDDAEPLVFVETLSHLLLQRDLLSEPGLRSVLGRIGQLPAAPDVHARLVRRLRDPNATLAEFAALVSEDSGLATQVLRLANGAYFGRGRSVSSLEGAAARLGTRLLTSVVLAAEAFGSFGKPAGSFSMDAFQHHASLVARIATGLEPRATWNDDAFSAGLLHDVGRLAIASQMPKDLARIEKRAAYEGLPLHVVEREVLGADHAAIGAALLAQWGLPTAVVEAVERHHELSLAGEFALDATMAVAVANRLARDVERFSPGTTAANQAAVAAGDPRWPWWRELAEQLTVDGMVV